MEFKYNTVEEAIQALKEGKIIMCTDDPDKENEGNFIYTAESVTTWGPNGWFGR